jgi:ribonucleotide monophosphatase NagD (HAD superfamily)
LCSGLFDEYDQDLNYYKDLLENHIDKKMICTNPDLIVDKGNERELCAGSVAMVFEKNGWRGSVFLVSPILKFIINQ